GCGSGKTILAAKRVPEHPDFAHSNDTGSTSTATRSAFVRSPIFRTIASRITDCRSLAAPTTMDCGKRSTAAVQCNGECASYLPSSCARDEDSARWALAWVRNSLAFF